MSDLTSQNLRRFRSRVDIGGHRLANDGRPLNPQPIRRLNAPITQPFSAVPETDDSGSDEHVENLIAGYALGALEPDEQLAVERHASYCPSCARLLAETRRTAAMLPFVAAPADLSPDVKAALFARISQSSAAITAARADEFAWARPVSPRNQATLPASRTWLESLPELKASSSLPVPRSRRSRPTLGRVAGISLPVLLTFGLLAFFVVPHIMPGDDNGNPDLAGLLSSDSTECVQTMATSSAIESACYNATLIETDGSSSWLLSVNNLVDDTPRDVYEVQIPTVDGTYFLAGTIQIDGRGGGSVRLTRPINFTNGGLCLTEAGEVANAVCPSILTAPAA